MLSEIVARFFSRHATSSVTLTYLSESGWHQLVQPPIATNLYLDEIINPTKFLVILSLFLSLDASIKTSPLWRDISPFTSIRLFSLFRCEMWPLGRKYFSWVTEINLTTFKEERNTNNAHVKDHNRASRWPS